MVPISELNEALSSEGLKDLRIDDLEHALKVYGGHLGGCPAWGRPRPDLCSCGYVAAFGTIANYESLPAWKNQRRSLSANEGAT